MKNLKIISASKKGIKRAKNQDSNFIFNTEEFCLFILFDGVSSYPDSYLFISEFKKELKREIKDYNSLTNLSRILFNINKKIIEKRIKGYSTFSLLLIDSKTRKGEYISIGDSRIYTFTNQFIEKKTIDDSSSLNRNLITKFLGSVDLTIKDFELKEIEYGLNYLICTDGFYETMEKNLKLFFETFNFKRETIIKKRLSLLQKGINHDDSSYIIIKNEV